MSEDAERPLTVNRRWYTEIWNQRRAETARELWADGCVGHMVGMPDASLDDFLEYHTHMLSAFPDFHLDMLDVVETDGRVVTHWKITGTHRSTFFGVPPTGRRIEEYGMTKFHIENGQVQEGWDNWNLGALLGRLSRPTAREIVRLHQLTERQAEVALLMAEKRSAKGIAKDLAISINTARRHCQAVLRRLGLHSRREVAELLVVRPDDVLTSHDAYEVAEGVQSAGAGDDR